MARFFIFLTHFVFTYDVLELGSKGHVISFAMWVDDLIKLDPVLVELQISLVL